MLSAGVVRQATATYICARNCHRAAELRCALQECNYCTPIATVKLILLLAIMLVNILYLFGLLGLGVHALPPPNRPAEVSLSRILALNAGPDCRKC